MVQLYGSTAANGVWFVPGTHRLGKVAIPPSSQGGKRAGCRTHSDDHEPGDVVISKSPAASRFLPQTQPGLAGDPQPGFHRRRAVLDVRSIASMRSPGAYDDDWISRRSALNRDMRSTPGVSIIRRTALHIPTNAEAGLDYRWDESGAAETAGYNKLDIFVLALLTASGADRTRPSPNQ